MNLGRPARNPVTEGLIRAAVALLLCVLLMIGLRLSDASPAPQILTGPALLQALQNGGLNIYFRHAATDWSQSDRRTASNDRFSCDPALMRQLSDAGREDSRRIGKAMRALQLPVSEVLASPYCRTMETARLMELGQVRASEAVMNLLAAAHYGGRPAIVNRARLLLASTPPGNGNRVIVAHGNVARESTPVYPGEGEGVVFRPLGADGFELVGRVLPQQWAQMQTSAGD